MQQPWNGLSPAQVVGAVAFQNRKLAIPPNTSPKLVSLMESCWAEKENSNNGCRLNNLKAADFGDSIPPTFVFGSRQQ
ncbi:hypothetical protein V6Z12_A06G037100 [Gossypium hirsutum]